MIFGLDDHLFTNLGIKLLEVKEKRRSILVFGEKDIFVILKSSNESDTYYFPN
jgi:hypothetical protein